MPPRTQKRQCPDQLDQLIAVQLFLFTYIVAYRRCLNLNFIASKLVSSMSSVRSTFTSSRFRDANDEFRKVRVSAPLAPDCFDPFVVDVRRPYAGGASQQGVGGIKLKYIDQAGNAVLIPNDEYLASCIEDSDI